MQFTTALLAVALGGIQLVSGTKVHANAGCILVGGQKLCSGSSYYNTGTGTSVQIYARFDSGNHDTQAWAGCGRTFTWPANYGDVYFGADNCLYDGNSNNIGGQCCQENVGRAYVTNPYA